MKNAIILHSVGSNPHQFWFPWLTQNLERKSYRVWAPQLPDPDSADLKVQLPYVLEHGEFNKKTILIGHSSGASLVLAVLDALNIKIKKAIMVAGFLTRGGARPKYAVRNESQYNWKKMRNNVGELFFINAVNDPWGCDDKQGMKMFARLGGTLILNNEGHMGSEKFKQPYRQFPLLLKLIIWRPQSPPRYQTQIIPLDVRVYKVYTLPVWTPPSLTLELSQN